MMPFDFEFIRSKVARRVIWLFFIAALVPIAITAYYSYNYLNKQFEEQSYKQLRHASKLYGMAVMDRLHHVDGKLKRLARKIEDSHNNPDTSTNTKYQNILANVDLEDEIEKLSLVWIPTSSVATRLQNSDGTYEAELISKKVNDGVGSQVYLRNITSIHNQGNSLALVAEINRQYLWGDEGRLPYSRSLCVLDTNGEVLFCPENDHKNLIAKMTTSAPHKNSKRTFTWVNHDGENLAVAWELFTNARFAGANWIIASSRLASDALMPVVTYRNYFPLWFLLSVLLVLLISLIQVRRIMSPLGQLVRATRRVSKYEFDEPVKINSNDEFRELGDSFNAMAARLDRQFNTLRVLSEIDRLILSYPDLDVVLTKIFETVNRIIKCNYIAITLPDNTDNKTAWTYYKKISKSTQVKVEKTEYDVNRWDEFKQKEVVQIINLTNGPVQCLAPLSRSGVSIVQVCPIFLDGEMRAIFTLGYCNPVEDKLEDEAFIRDLIDRVAVALATADRDEKLYRQAHFDFLTGLPNRQLFHDRLEQHIIRARRTKNRAAILYIDLDRFKNINDSLGHASGDSLLRMVAKRMKDCVRETDTVSRLGGDEFVILLSNVSSPTDAGYIAEHVISEVSKPFMLNTNEIFISASIGIVIYPEDGSDHKELMAHADAAMYHAKECGRARYKFFEESMNKELMQRIELENAMRHAIDRGEFSLSYQPQISPHDGRVTALEALIRWHHPMLGMIRPGEFIPLAEESGLIDQIGEWVLETACNQYQVWRKNKLAPNKLAVNISSQQFARENFIEVVENALKTSGMNPRELELEITESLLLDESININSMFERLSEMGVQLAIDDFGTGYSSLGYLKRFSVHTLKIDRAFSCEIPVDRQATTLTLSIINMAHALNMTVVAEGIELKEQLDLLRENNCDYVQGFYFSEPLTAKDMESYLSRNSTNSNYLN